MSKFASQADIAKIEKRTVSESKEHGALVLRSLGGVEGKGDGLANGIRVKIPPVRKLHAVVKVAEQMRELARFQARHGGVKRWHEAPSLGVNRSCLCTQHHQQGWVDVVVVPRQAEQDELIGG